MGFLSYNTRVLLLQYNFFNLEADQEPRGSLIATMAGSASGVLFLLLFIVSLMVIISVVMYLKHRQKSFNLTTNVAYAGQCKNEDIDYYSISQPSPETDVENKNEEGESLEQNVAYQPTSTTVQLSPNVAYESHDHVHQGTESQDEYEYISNGTV